MLLLKRNTLVCYKENEYRTGNIKKGLMKDNTS